MEKTEKIKTEKKRQATNHGAMEKCRAVLAVWTVEQKAVASCCGTISRHYSRKTLKAYAGWSHKFPSKTVKEHKSPLDF